MDRSFGYDGMVGKTLDGDTVVADLINRVDIGFGISAPFTMADQRLRLAGMDAKPVKTTKGTEANEWLKARTGAGTGRKLAFATVKNKLGKEQHEKYGRWLIYIFLYEDDGSISKRSLNEEMIEVGLATPWDGKGPHPE